MGNTKHAKPGTTLEVWEVPAFSRVRVTKLGSFNGIGDDTELLDAEVIMWTSEQEVDDINDQLFGEMKVRGVLTPNDAEAWQAGELWWLSEDGEVEMIAPPTYIGQPEDYVPVGPPLPPVRKRARNPLT